MRKNLIFIQFFAIFLLAIPIANSTESKIKFSDDRIRHSDLATAQVILALGCEGKLGLRQKSQAHKLTERDDRNIQQCTDSAATDISSNLLVDLKNSKFEKSRLTVHLIHESVIFAKENWPPLRSISTEKIIEQARTHADRLYPFPSQKK